MKKTRFLTEMLLAFAFVLLMGVALSFSAFAGDLPFEGCKYGEETDITFYAENNGETYDFTGEAVRPVMGIYYLDSAGEKVYLTEDVDYTVSYYDSVTPGRYEVCFYSTGDSDYCFNSSIQYRIGIDPDQITVGKISDLTFNGSYCYPEPKLYYKGRELDRDYYYFTDYTDNYYAGTAKVTAVLSDWFCSEEYQYTKEFYIKPCPASKITAGKIPDQIYTGEAIKPDYFEVRTSFSYLYQGEDYSVKYSSNKLPGTATATLKFKGNYTGTKTLNFKIKVTPVDYVSKYPSTDRAGIYAYGYGKYDYIQLYRYSSSSKKYVLIKNMKDGYYEDTGLKQLTVYKYKVRTAVKIDSKKYYGEYKSFSVRTLLTSPAVTLTTKKNSVSAKWSKNSKATSYILYKQNFETGKTKKLGSFNSKTFKFTDKNVTNYTEYFYYVIACRKSGSKTYKSQIDYEKGASSVNPESIVRGASLKPGTSFKEYDVQGSKTSLMRTVQLSSSDIATLKKFAKKHFTSKMTSLDKVRFTLNWINKNVTYADKAELWNRASKMTFVDAVFNNNIGQCSHYNGAMCSMMKYLGYDVKLLKGYRTTYSGSKIQHFWTECTINGLTYVVEAGNYGRNGDWSYLLRPYKYTSGYMKNGKPVSGIKQ